MHKVGNHSDYMQAVNFISFCVSYSVRFIFLASSRILSNFLSNSISYAVGNASTWHFALPVYRPAWTSSIIHILIFVPYNLFERIKKHYYSLFILLKFRFTCQI